jgi:hypothetical protein
MENTTTLSEKKWYNYKGSNFLAYNDAEAKTMMNKQDYERSIFYRSKVYTYSCFARKLDDGNIELHKSYNNGESREIVTFKSIDDFWKGI